MHPRKILWFAKFNIMCGITVEKQFGAECFAKDAIKLAFQEGLTHHTGRDTFIVHPPGRIISVEVESREAEDEELKWHRGPRWNI